MSDTRPNTSSCYSRKRGGRRSARPVCRSLNRRVGRDYLILLGLSTAAPIGWPDIVTLATSVQVDDSANLTSVATKLPASAMYASLLPRLKPYETGSPAPRAQEAAAVGKDS